MSAASVMADGGADLPAPPARSAIFMSPVGVTSRERTMLSLAAALVRDGGAVDVVTAGAPTELTDAMPAGVRLVDLRRLWMGLPPFRGRSKSRIYASVRGLARYLRRERPDVMLSVSIPPNLVALHARRRAGTATPLIVRQSNPVHMPESPYDQVRPRPRDRRIARWYPEANAVVAVSQSVAVNIQRFAGLPRTRVCTIANKNVEPAFDALASEPVKHPWLTRHRRHRVLIAAGRLVAKKEYPTLLRALALVRRTSDVRLIILGAPGPETDRINGFIGDLDLVQVVDQVGFRSNTFAWFARADCFVLASRSEGMPNVLVEALASGCPVVSTDCPTGPSEILAGGTYGRLVPVGDAPSMARAVGATLAEPPDRQMLVERGRAFTQDRAVADYRRVLQAVARGTSLPGSKT